MSYKRDLPATLLELRNSTINPHIRTARHLPFTNGFVAVSFPASRMISRTTFQDDAPKAEQPGLWYGGGCQKKQFFHDRANRFLSKLGMARRGRPREWGFEFEVINIKFTFTACDCIFENVAFKKPPFQFKTRKVATGDLQKWIARRLPPSTSLWIYQLQELILIHCKNLSITWIHQLFEFIDYKNSSTTKTHLQELIEYSLRRIEYSMRER